jgi:hypothetical protein
VPSRNAAANSAEVSVEGLSSSPAPMRR